MDEVNPAGITLKDTFSGVLFRLYECAAAHFLIANSQPMPA